MRLREKYKQTEREKRELWREIIQSIRDTEKGEIDEEERKT